MVPRQLDLGRSLGDLLVRGPGAGPEVEPAAGPGMTGPPLDVWEILYSPTDVPAPPPAGPDDFVAWVRSTWRSARRWLEDHP